MAKHDIVTYNPTTQGFETDLGDNTAQIKGDSEKVFSVESGSTNLFSVGTSTNSITLNSHITASGNISSSLASSASFGRIVFTKITGDGSQMTNVNEIGHVSGAAQVASRISGAFNAGFVTLGDISGSVTSTGSFGKVFANTYVGDASQMTNVNEDGHFSGSAQLASDISGSFNKGFTHEETISGSLTSSGSFGRLNWSGQISANASEVTNLNENGFISSSAQLSADISGSFNKGFEFENSISGSATSTGSFGRVNIDGVITGDASQVTGVSLSTNTVSGSAQLASDISGSFNKGLLYSGTISGSMQSSASFFVVSASTYNVTNVSNINTPLQQIEGLISQSSQIVTSTGASRISGSFNIGFEFDGTISGSETSTGSFTRADAVKLQGDGSRIGGLTQTTGLISSSAQIAADISGSFNKGFGFQNSISGSATSTGSFNHVVAQTYQGDFSAITANADGSLSGSSGIASDISGSFNKGFEFTGNISGSATSTGSLSNFKSDTFVTNNMTVGVQTGSFSTASLNTSTNKSYIIPYVGDAYYDSRQYVPTSSGQIFSCGSCTEFSNGYNSADGQLSIGRDGILNISFQTSSATDNGNGITAGSWSAGANMITGTRANMFGTQNASVVVSGNTESGEGATTSHTQHYNGLSWRRGADILNAVGAPGGGQGYGTSEDDVGALRSYTNGPINKHQQYGGFSWWQMTVNVTNGRNQGAAGTQNAAVIWAGSTSPFTQTEEWNGHAWNAAANLSNGRYGRVGAGSQNAAIAGGGIYAPANTELYNGTNWSDGPAIAYSATNCQADMSGTQNDAIAHGSTDAATWDGTSWSATVALPGQRHKAGIAGSSGVGMIAGGGNQYPYAPSADSFNTTIEWNNSFNTGSYLLTKKIGSNYS